jgi:hypothetical protein
MAKGALGRDMGNNYCSKYALRRLEANFDDKIIHLRKQGRECLPRQI